MPDSQPAPPLVALPMYGVTRRAEMAYRRFAEGVLDHLDHRLRPLARVVTAGSGSNVTLWRDRQLLLGQACGYPLMKHLGAHARIVAIPEYAFPGCSGPTHRSLLVVRESESRPRLKDFRGAVAACNDSASNSGMNLLRHSVAGLNRDGRFFRAVKITGSHLAGLQAVAAGDADLVAVDCVTFGYIQRDEPHRLAGLRVLAATAATPALPFITAAGNPVGLDRLVREIMAHTLADDAFLRTQLALSRVHAPGAVQYQQVLDLERAAAAAGYPLLA